MGKITLGEVAIESKVTWKSDKVGVPIVGLEHLEPGEITLSNWEIDSENTFTKKFSKGQVLLGRRRVYLRKAVIAPVDGICSGDITVIEAIPGKILPELLPFVIQNDKFFDYAVQGSAGSLSPRVKWEHLKKYSFELPSIDEQKILANKLWAAYRLKESYKKLLSATDEMVKSQFIEMFSAMPTTPVKTYVDDSFPGEWGTEDTVGDGVKVIRTTNFTNSGKLNLTDVVTRSIEDRKIARKQIKKYDTILERSGGTADNPVGRVVLFEEDDLFLCNNFTQVLRFKDIDPRFAFYSLYYFYQTNKTAIRSMGSKTTGIQNLNMSKYLEIGIPNASDEEQKEFVAIAEQADKSKFTSLKSQFIEMFWGGKYTMKKLRGHIEVLRGVSYKPSDVHEDLSDNTSIVLRSNNIDGGQVNFDDLVYVDSERVSEHQVLNAGDIVMCGSNGSKKLVGKAALLNETPRENTSFGAFCLGIRCKSSIIPEYLATYFQTSLYRDKIEALGSGSNILNIKPDHIYDLEIPIPSLGEQETFVSIVKQADKSKYIN